MFIENLSESVFAWSQTITRQVLVFQTYVIEHAKNHFRLLLYNSLYFLNDKCTLVYPFFFIDFLRVLVLNSIQNNV